MDSDLSGFTQSRKEMIDLFLASQENLLASFTEFYDLAWLSKKENIENIFCAVNRSGVMTDIGVIDAAGNHVAYVGPFAEKLAGKNYASAPWFKKVMENGRYISDIFTGYRGIPHLVVAVADKEKSWVLRATINSEMFNGLVSSANVGPDGDAFIISRAGEFQTPSRLGHQSISAGNLEVLQDIAAGGTQTQRRGQYLFSVAPLKGDAWLLVLKTDIHASLADFYTAKKIGLSIIFCTALLILFATQLLIRSLVNRIDHTEQQRMVLTNKVREVEKMALIGRLAASVAHEINNPLQVISAQAGWVDELLDDGPGKYAENESEYRLAVKKIRDQVKRAGSITNRLLSFSRMQEGAPAAVDINHTVEDSILLLEKEAKSNRINITRQYQQDLPEVKTDASQLQQVFLNILNNAVDAIGQDGAIEVRTTRRDGEIVIEFADTGPGIAEHIMENIFNPFFTTKEKGKGTGLGLAISSNIMQRLRGGLRVANRPHGGCLFTVALPANGQPAVHN
jgi:two-component system NtrC family sensor kinase